MGLMRSIVAVAAVVLLSLPFASMAMAASTCSDCHGMPPLDAAYRNITTGGFKGSHQTHQPAVAAAGNCAACHTGSATYTTAHMDEVIQLSANVNTSPVAATYSKGVFFNQTSRPVMGTCANVNCHFEQVTTPWSTAPLASPGNCNVCHGAPPSDGSHPMAAGAGKKHGDYYGTTVASCGKCHPDHTTEAKPFAHATSAGHRGLALRFTSPNSGGTYSKTVNLAYPAYLPSQTPATSRNGTCSSMYCHSDGNGGAPNTDPVWGGSLAADCSGCHGGNAAAARVITTGSHAQHVNSGAIIGTNYSCGACHSTTVAGGDDLTVTGIANHVNGTKTVALSGSGTYSPGAKTCAATSCHASGKSAAPQPPVPVWGGAALNCSGCHGTSTTTGMPDYVNGGAGAVLANSHARHVSTAADCDSCHTGTTTTGTAIKAGSTLHANSLVDVTFNSAKAGAGAAWTAGTKSCSSTYCHGATVPVWGGTLPADCSGCHGNNGTSSLSIATGRHASHVNNAAVLGINNNFGCVDCHARTVSGDRVISTPANHVNGFADYTGIRAGGSARYNSNTKVCSNVYCHSNGNPAARVFISMTGSKNWTGSATLGCSGCHGRSNPTTGAPDYSNGGSGTATANSHAKHVAGAGIVDTRGCANCHRRTVDLASAGKLRNYSTLHLSGQPNVYFSPTIGGSYNGAASTCSATYCHGTTASPAWGAPSLACNACHGGNSALPGAHVSHYGDTALPTRFVNFSGNVSTSTTYRFTCSSCHASGAGKAIHAGGPANASAAAQVFFGYTTTTQKGSYSFGTLQGADNGFNWTNGTCATTYCHGNGAGGTGTVTAFTWASPVGSLGCAGCHGGDAVSTSPIASGKHTAHINNAAQLGTNFGCIDCHAKTVSSNTAIANKRNHVNKFREYSGVRAGGSSRYNASTKQCSNNYCHSNGRGVYANPASWTSTATLGCNGCHGTSTATGAPDYPNGGAGTSTPNNHARHVAAASDCDKCHAGTTTSGTAVTAGSTLHINGAINVTFNSAKAGAGAVWSKASMTCANTYCHGTASPVWGALLPTNCTGCHGGTASSPAPIATNAHGTHLSKTYGPGSYLGSSVTSCQACHVYSSTQPDSQHSNGVTDVITGAGSACAGCHPGTLPVWSVSSRLSCTVCHAPVASKLPNGIAAPYKANFATAGHGLYSVSNQCTACHDQDSAHISGSLGDNMRLYMPNDNSLCGSCHDNTTAPLVSTHVLDKNATPTPSLCKSCHDVHGTSNVAMIRTTINGVNVSFTNTSTGFVQLVAPYRGLCQVCHTLTSHYKAGQALDGHPTRNCLSCHSHRGTYAFQASTACDSCHGYPPVPAGFAGTRGNYSSARVENYLGGGGAHAIVRHVKPTARPAEGWANCTMCHGNGSVNPATHTMTMPVTPSKITVDMADRYKFNPDITLNSSRYSGVLQDGGANATGSCSNVKCHFKPSKKWSPLK